MFHPSMKDIYTNHICQDPLSRHALRMTCRQLWKWIPVNVEFVHNVQILMRLRESQEFIRLLITDAFSGHVMNITPHQCTSRVVTQPKPPKRADIPFTLENGYKCDFLFGCTMDRSMVMKEMFQAEEDAYRIIEVMVRRKIEWIFGISTVLCQLS